MVTNAEFADLIGTLGVQQTELLQQQKRITLLEGSLSRLQRLFWEHAEHATPEALEREIELTRDIQKIMGRV